MKYEKDRRMEESSNKVPQHVGIIMDGNRRFAKKLMLKPWKGHEWGAQKLEKLYDWCKELGVKEMTLYTFSVENFNRPEKEFNYLMDLFRKEFARFKEEEHKVHEHKIRVNFIGRIWMFPKDIQEMMKEVMESTKEYNEGIVNFAMAYGGRAEVIDAAKKIAKLVNDGKLKVDDINEEVFSRSLYMEDEPELIIRTGGDHRTSNFLMYQGAYSEWIFLEKMWPEFEKEDFAKCIEDFGNRERRFGK